MSNLALAVAELHRSERALARRLYAIAARHHADHDIRHLARDLAGWSDDHVAILAEHDAAHRRAWRDHRLVYWAQERLSDALRHRSEPSLLLLADLRRLHRAAAGVSLDWELLAQGAQAVKDHDLLDVARRCHPQTLRQMRWANAMLKELAPQALAG